ncbi:acyl-Coenzyme A oxidase [Saguinus oedipus]|uniref:Acyl-Coenzyme A oxidase n=1 Tax=Saguinus oedipus TaxID=9490 RepID=A0ABQ9W1Y9_SAGOE|nr:acyl-Coenzyme A oxidase [Saguinus oedipus]
MGAQRRVRVSQELPLPLPGMWAELGPSPSPRSSRCRPVLQVFHGRPLALAFMELMVLQRFHEHVHRPCVPPSLRAVLGRLSALYALWSLNCHTALLYRG